MAWTKAEPDPRRVGITPSVLTLSEVTANDSDKSWTCDEDAVLISAIWVEYTASGDAGNRIPGFEIQDSSGDVLFRVRADMTIAAAGVKKIAFVEFGGVLIDSGNDVITPLPSPLWLRRGEVLRIYDVAAIAAAADDVVIHVRALAYKGGA